MITKSGMAEENGENREFSHGGRWLRHVGNVVKMEKNTTKRLVAEFVVVASQHHRSFASLAGNRASTSKVFPRQLSLSFFLFFRLRSEIEAKGQQEFGLFSNSHFSIARKKYTYSERDKRPL